VGASRRSLASYSFSAGVLRLRRKLVARFQEAKFSFEEAGLADDEEIVQITAYVLQVNGAKPGNQALTRETTAVINSIVK